MLVSWYKKCYFFVSALWLLHCLTYHNNLSETHWQKNRNLQTLFIVGKLKWLFKAIGQHNFVCCNPCWESFVCLPIRDFHTEYQGCGRPLDCLLYSAPWATLCVMVKAFELLSCFWIWISGGRQLIHNTPASWHSVLTWSISIAFWNLKSEKFSFTSQWRK